MGGHGHGHGHAPYKVPSYDSYKIEDAPELLRYQQRLTRAGLKDPWIRNFIWAFDKRYGTMLSRGGWMMLRGIPTGVIAFGITLAIENALGIDYHPWHHAHEHDASEHKGSSH